MTNEKSPEQMADPFNQAKYEAEAKEIYCIGGERATGIWAVYVRGAKHGFKDGLLAGFQKCEATVAQPLREENELAMFACKVAKEEIAALTAELEREKRMVDKAYKFLREGKALFTPNTTNSLVDDWLEDYEGRAAMAAMAEGKAE